MLRTLTSVLSQRERKKAPGSHTYNKELRAIQIIDQLSILLIDDWTFHFERGSHLAFVDRKFFRQQSDAAHAFVVSQVRGDRGDLLLHNLHRGRGLREFSVTALRVFTCNAQSALQSFPLRHN